MTLVREPFERQTLEEDYIKADIVRVRLNHKERLMLEAVKMSYNEKNDSTALKQAAFLFIKQGLFYEEVLRK